MPFKCNSSETAEQARTLTGLASARKSRVLIEIHITRILCKSPASSHYCKLSEFRHVWHTIKSKGNNLSGIPQTGQNTRIPSPFRGLNCVITTSMPSVSLKELIASKCKLNYVTVHYRRWWWWCSWWLHNSSVFHQGPWWYIQWMGETEVSLVFVCN